LASLNQKPKLLSLTRIALSATFVMSETSSIPRFFKTAWFAKATSKAGIQDLELCKILRQTQDGQADDLGGGVLKKRVHKNMFRAIVLGKGRSYWVLVYLFAKKRRANIDNNELEAFRKLADIFEKKTDKDIQRDLEAGVMVEICHGETQIQE
jgi:hypothetical protein